MLNKKNNFNLVLALPLVIFILLLLSCVTYKWQDVSYNGESSRVLENTSWAFTLDNVTPGMFVRALASVENVEFQSNGKFNVPGVLTSSWERKDNNIKFVMEKGYYYGEGKYDPEFNVIMGTITCSEGKKAVFSMFYLGPIGTRYSSYISKFSTTGNSLRTRGESIRVGNRIVAFTGITGYNGNETALRIPPIIDRALVVGIGRGAFNNKQITSVIIPNQINAGRSNDIDFQYMVNILAGGANLPDIDGYSGISNIGEFAFANNPITRISIGSDVRISANAFDNNFVQFYENNGRKAGVYRYINNRWNYEFK